jgi:hypothetical protein
MTKLVPPRAVRVYAEALGWKQVPGVNGRIAVYANPKDPLRQLVVPLDERLDDYADRTAEAIIRIANFENRPPREVLDHLLLPPADVLRFREVSPSAESGDLPLDHAVRTITGMKRALLAVAHSALVPQAFHARMSRSEAEEFVSRCRLGQTERGSYTLTLACPLDVQIGLFGPNGVPFARRVTSLFLDTLDALVQAPGGDTLETLADPTRFPGVSANFCESLLLLRPEGDRAYVSVSASWSRAYMPPTREAGREVRIRQEAFDVAEALAPRLRTLPSPRMARFFGFVDVLRGQPTPYDPRPSGEVHFTLVEPDGDVVSARADLSPEDYAVAGAAHLANEVISFRGILRPQSRMSRIDEITGFERVAWADHPAEPQATPGAST